MTAMDIFCKEFETDDISIHSKIIKDYFLKEKIDYILKIIKLFLDELYPVYDIKTEFKDCFQYYYSNSKKKEKSKFYYALEKVVKSFLGKSIKEFLL